MRKFHIEECYDDGCLLFEKDTVALETGVTVLVGCNGSGKSTLIRQIQTHLDTEDIPYMSYNNLWDGGNNAKQAALLREDMEYLMQSTASSEGETIYLNLNRLAGKLGAFFKAHNGIKEFFLLMDAIDSGLSIDNILELKELFQYVIEDNPSVDIYIVVAANTFELASGENCLDVQSVKYLSFNSYEEYKQFVLKSCQKKEERYKNQ